MSGAGCQAASVIAVAFTVVFVLAACGSASFDSTRPGIRTSDAGSPDSSRSSASGSTADAGANTSSEDDGADNDAPGAGLGGVCESGASQCSGNEVQTCGSSGQWSTPAACGSDVPLCMNGSCSAPSADGGAVTPPSCLPGGPGRTDCGPGGSGSESCCASLEVSPGAFYRTYDPLDSNGDGIVAPDGGPADEADPATVSGFRLDKYLVTVGRFRQYVNYVTGSAGAAPANGAGLHAHLNGGSGLANSESPGSFETGWDATDWDSEIATGPAAASTWDANLACDPCGATWTSTAGTQENLPINCVDWYESYAFCIWDGGFLPSEAEWGYAAAGGSQQREYPWGSTDPGTGITYAIYNCNYPITASGIAPVGTTILGAAYWGQFDMAGEVYEWNLDDYAPYVDPCTNCAYLSPTSFRVVRGGNFSVATAGLLASSRNFTNPPTRDIDYGFRCARAP